MKKYVVGYINFFDNVLKLRIVKAEGWYDALHKAFEVGVYLPVDMKDIEEAKAEAFNQDWMFTVQELKKVGD